MISQIPQYTRYAASARMASPLRNIHAAAEPSYDRALVLFLTRLSVCACVSANQKNGYEDKS